MTNTDAAAAPSREDIARLAYEFYEARGRHDGHDLDDWLAAEHWLSADQELQRHEELAEVSVGARQ